SPVDSITTSAPRSAHGSLPGSRSANALNDLPLTVISSADDFTSYGSRPRIESYLSRWARVALSVRSLAPTSSTSAPEASTARKKWRPIRQTPLIPPRAATEEPPLLCAGDPPGGPMGPRPPGRRPVVGLVAAQIVTLSNPYADHARGPQPRYVSTATVIPRV